MSKAFSSITQIGIIVPDAKQTAKNLLERLGWHPTCTRETMRIPGRTYRGADEDFACSMIFYQLPGIEIELIEPLTGRSCWSDYKALHRSGIHHLLFDLADSATSIEALSRHGIEIEQRGRALPYGEHAFWAYVTSQSQLGFIMELTNRSEHPSDYSAPPAVSGPFSQLLGVGVTVKNLESTSRAWRDVLGWTPDEPSGRICGNLFRGVESFSVSGSMTYRLPTLTVELTRPVSGASVAQDYLGKHGEGIYCLIFEVQSKAAVQELVDLGIRVLEQGHALEDDRVFRWSILDTRDLFGFYLKAVYS